jgi:hypothetical protein
MLRRAAMTAQGGNRMTELTRRLMFGAGALLAAAGACPCSARR